MKITTEKLPKSILSLQIELDGPRLERGLDQAARRLSKRFPIHGFRPGKAPRFMIERTYGRDALIEEASEDLINKAYRDALTQEKIEPVGPPQLVGVSSSDPFVFTVAIPVAPTVDIGDYRAIRASLEVSEVDEEQVDRAMDILRDKHVVLKELDEARPAQEGDQLKVTLLELVDGKPLAQLDDEEDADDDDDDEEYEYEDEDDEDDEEDDDDDDDEEDDDDDDEEDNDEEDDDDDDEEDDDDDDEEDEGYARETTLDLVQGRLVDELYNNLIGLNVDDSFDAESLMPEDHANERVRGKTVTFKGKVLSIQERMLPDWEELPTLENFEGDLDALRAKTRTDLEKATRDAAERKATDAYIEALVAQTEFDIPDVIVRELADSMLHDQGREFSRYGITLEQMLQYRGQTHDEAVDQLMPEAEKQTKVTLALREVLFKEQITVSNEEIDAEVQKMLEDYPEEQREGVKGLLSGQMRSTVLNVVIDRKLRERVIAIATGNAPDVTTAEAVSDDDATEPETTEPETAEPETAEPETAEPETAEPETAEPETAAGEDEKPAKS